MRTTQPLIVGLGVLKHSVDGHGEQMETEMRFNKLGQLTGLCLSPTCWLAGLKVGQRIRTLAVFFLKTASQPCRMHIIFTCNMSKMSWSVNVVTYNISEQHWYSCSSWFPSCRSIRASPSSSSSIPPFPSGTSFLLWHLSFTRSLSVSGWTTDGWVEGSGDKGRKLD